MANKTYNNVQTNVKFTKASTRTDLNTVTTENPTGETNENIVLTLGKISKWYESLVPAGGSSGKFLGWNSDGTAKWVNNPNVDTKVNVTLATTTKAYLLGTSTTPTSTATGVTSVADTGVYLGTTAGSLYAGDFYTTGTDHGYWLKDNNGTYYAGIFDNNQNLWIGARASTQYHHKGQTFISTGWTGTLPTTSGQTLTGYPSIKVSIPTYTSNGSGGSWSHVCYQIIHEGNFATTGSGNAITGVAFTSNKLTFTKGSTFLTQHPTITLSADTTSTPTQLSHAGTFTAITSVTREGNGHVTKINTATYTLPDQYVHPGKTQTDTTSTASPAHGGTFTVVDSVTRDTCGHVSGINVKTVTLPNDQNTKVTQTAVGDDYTDFRPLVISASSSSTKPPTASTVTDGTFITSGIFCQPSASTIYAAYYKTTATARGYFLIDSSSTEYPGIYDNGTNLWIGSLASTSKHHIGETYISAGHNGTNGNSTIFVAVPNAANNNADTYPVLHSGNYTSYTVTKTGSGASGTWGINITGNAATATKTGIRWNAVSQGQKWSRLYYSEPAVNVEGSNGILSISCTRANVVVNAVFLVLVSHPGSNASHIIELASTNYSTIRCRVVSSSNGSYYFEIYDTANNIASGTSQTWHCCFVTLTNATLTTYTAFTDGSTIPSNFAAANDFTTTVGSASAAIKNISRSGTTFTATRQDGTTFTFTQQDNDRYVNSASFADDTTNTAASPVKMTLTRAGSDTTTVTANIPKVSSSSAGVAPKGAAVSTQSQSTKFLREDGSWAAPSYTTNTDTKNTAGSTDTSSKIFLIGATSQAANPQTYSDNEVFTTSGVLTTKKVQVGGGSATMEYDSTAQCIDFLIS